MAMKGIVVYGRLLLCGYMHDLTISLDERTSASQIPIFESFEVIGY